MIRMFGMLILFILFAAIVWFLTGWLSKGNGTAQRIAMLFVAVIGVLVVMSEMGGGPVLW